MGRAPVLPPVALDELGVAVGLVAATDGGQAEVHGVANTIIDMQTLQALFYMICCSYTKA